MNVLALSNCPVVEHEGSGYNIINTAKSFSDLGHEVSIIPPASFLFMPFLKGRAHIYHMAFGMARWIYLNRKSLSKYKLIMLYGAESAIALFLIKSILNIKVPIILHSNGLEVHVGFRMKHFSEYHKNRQKWYHLELAPLFKYCYRKVDAIITVSKYDYDFAIKHLQIPSSKVYFNEPSLPELFFDFRDGQLPVKKKLITYCGTWIDRKGIDSIKEALPGILRKYPNYSLRLIGVGHGFKSQDHFPEDILSQIEVHPLVTGKEQMIKMYEESTIFLFPSFCESFGLVVAEAMFCGCAVITGPTGFAADIKNNEEAIVLDLPNGPNVYQALEKLILDKELRQRLELSGRRRTKHLRWSNYRIRLNEILEDIFKIKRGRPKMSMSCATCTLPCKKYAGSVS